MTWGGGGSTYNDIIKSKDVCMILKTDLVNVWNYSSFCKINLSFVMKLNNFSKLNVAKKILQKGGGASVRLVN